MKRITFTLAALLSVVLLYAQQDSSAVLKKADTIRIGGMVIIKRGGNSANNSQNKITIGRRKQKHSNISTANWIVDIGFANYIDNTDYMSATLQDYIVNKPGSPALGKK